VFGSIDEGLKGKLGWETSAGKRDDYVLQVPTTKTSEKDDVSPEIARYNDHSQIDLGQKRPASRKVYQQ
jgi:hypothetical protein